MILKYCDLLFYFAYFMDTCLQSFDTVGHGC